MLSEAKQMGTSKFGTQYATGDQWRNNSRKNEETERKQKQYTFVEVIGDRSTDW